MLLTDMIYLDLGREGKVPTPPCLYIKAHHTHNGYTLKEAIQRPHETFSMENWIMVRIKFFPMRILQMDIHSLVGSPISRQMLSIAIFTILRGFARELTSTSCFFLMDLGYVGARQR